MIKTLYDNLARIRDAKKQAAAIGEKAPADSPVRAAAKTLTDEARRGRERPDADAGRRADRTRSTSRAAWTTSSSRSTARSSAPERRLGSPALERYKDLKPEADKLLARSKSAIATEIPAFNAIASKAGLATIK